MTTGAPTTIIVCADARVIREISTKYAVLGITAVGDELFVLQEREALFLRFNKPIAVYCINTYLKLRRLKVPEFKPDRNSDITSCVRHKCLYMYGYADWYICKYDLASSAVSKWYVDGHLCGLSVTPSCNLLVICKESIYESKKPDDLLELSAASGQRLRKIALPSDMKNLSHSVQLTTRQFVVCHGLRQVSLVVDGGKVTRSYGGKEGSDVEQLNKPCHLAVDKDSQFVFVADKLNHRVALLSPTLEFVRDLIEWLSCPRRLYFHQATRRLFVGEEHGGKITVIQL